jgi:kynurenine formamidase
MQFIALVIYSYFYRLIVIMKTNYADDRIASALTVNEENLPNHHILLGKEILLIENLTNLDKLPDHVFTFQCFPLKVENADGSPVRAIALIDG